MAAASYSYAYVPSYGKPRHLQSEGRLQIDAGINLFMYEGFFTTEAIASIVTPLAEGATVMFPEELQGRVKGYHWRGAVAVM